MIYYLSIINWCLLKYEYKKIVFFAAIYLYFQESDNLWWDAFATEFFEDDATLTLTFCLEDGPKRYSKISLLSLFIIAMLE